MYPTAINRSGVRRDNNWMNSGVLGLAGSKAAILREWAAQTKLGMPLSVFVFVDDRLAGGTSTTPASSQGVLVNS